MQQERRKQVFTSPSFDNRVFRKGTIKGYSQNQRKDLDTSDPMQAAQAMRNMGMKMGEDGSLMPTQNWGGLMGKASQQLNALSRGAQAGEGSGLGGPAGTMYDRAPGFYNRAPSGLARGDYGTGSEGFGQMLAQTREQRVAQSQQDGTFGTIRDKYNLDNAGKGMQMNEFGNLVKKAAAPKAAPLPDDTPGAASSAARAGMMKPRAFSEAVKGAGNRPVENALIEKRGFGKPDRFFASGEGKDTPASGKFFVEGDPNAPKSVALSTQASNRAALDEAVTAKKLLQEAQRPFMQIESSGGDKSIQTPYGSGSSTQTGPKQESRVNGQSFADMMQGLATKQVREGTWREGDAMPYEDQNDGLDPNKVRRGVKDITEENRQKILSRQRIAAKSK